MKLTNWTLWTGLIATVNALNCQEDPILKKYDLEKLQILQDIENRTPPSVTRDTWFLDICGHPQEKDTSLPQQCDKDDLLCGLESVKVGKGDPLITKIVDFKRSLKSIVSENTDTDDKGLKITFQDNKWGSYNLDAVLEFQCDSNLIKDKIEQFVWNESTISFLIKGPSGCLKGKEDNGDDKKGHDGDDKKDPERNGPQHPPKDKGFSWPTWIIIYTILSTLIYLSIVSYTNTRGGDLNDFRIEFVQRSRDLFFSLPRFIKEIIGRIFGSNGVTQRDGYSAL